MLTTLSRWSSYHQSIPRSVDTQLCHVCRFSGRINCRTCCMRAFMYRRADDRVCKASAVIYLSLPMLPRKLRRLFSHQLLLSIHALVLTVAFRRRDVLNIYKPQAHMSRQSILSLGPAAPVRREEASRHDFGQASFRVTIFRVSR